MNWVWKKMTGIRWWWRVKIMIWSGRRSWWKNNFNLKISNEIVDDEEFWVLSDVKGSCILDKGTSFVKLKMDSEILKVKWKKIRLVIKCYILVSLKMKLMSLLISLDLKKWVTLCLMIFKSSKVLDSIVIEWITYNHYIFLEILDLKILLENINLTRQVNSILQTQQYDLQRVVFSNGELKRQQRDIELVNNKIINPEMEKIIFKLDFMQ